MKLFLARHGETQWNLENRLQGRKNSPLTKNGHRQIELMKEFFSEIKLDAVYSSTLKRAAITAKAVADSKHMSLIKSTELQEISFGVCEGMTKEEISKKFPGLWEARHFDKYNFRIPKGESYADLFERTRIFLKKLEKKHKDGTILVVTHGCIGRTIIKYFLKNIPNEEIVNLGITHHYVYEIDSNGETKIFHINLEDGEKKEGVLPVEVMQGKND